MTAAMGLLGSHDSDKSIMFMLPVDCHEYMLILRMWKEVTWVPMHGSCAHIKEQKHPLLLPF